MKAKIARGAHKGQPLSPHRYADGSYVVSPTRFEADYVRVSSLDEAKRHVEAGYSLRMSNPAVRPAPSLISPRSITLD